MGRETWCYVPDHFGIFSFMLGAVLLSFCCILWVLSGAVILDGERRDGAMWQLTSGFSFMFGAILLSFCCSLCVLSGTLILDGEGRDVALWQLTSGFLVSCWALFCCLFVVFCGSCLAL